MDRKDIKVKVFKEKVPVSLKPLEITLLGKPAEAVLYKANFMEGYAELRVPLGNKNKVTIDELFPYETLKKRLKAVQEEVESILEDHKDFLFNTEFDTNVEEFVETLKDVEDAVDVLIECIEEEGYEEEESVHKDQISIFDLDDEE